MTIRTKLNLALAAIIGVFLVAGAVAIQAVRRSATATQAYLEVRNQGKLTSDFRTDLGRHAVQQPEPPADWPGYLLEDVAVQIRLSSTDRERRLWEQFDTAVRGLAEASATDRAALLAEAERTLLQLRHDYDTEEVRLIAEVGNTGLVAHGAIVISCLVAVLLFLIYLLLVRDWLVRPVHLLSEAADAIGRGQLHHTVPLMGTDELAALARRLEAMGASLARQQAALLEARELSAVGELCTSVAHGLRNPLAALRMSAQLAARASSDRRPVEIMEQVDRLDHRISKLLEFSRMPRPRWMQVTFADLVQSARAAAHPLLASRGITVEVDDQATERMWRLDHDLLASALAELLTNAALHSQPGATVRVCGHTRPATAHEPARLEMAVVDEGAGMSAETATKAFNLFFTSRPEGTGVGLSMVQRIVERHRGAIAIDSELGAGTTVRLWVPDDAAPSAGEAAQVA